MIKNYLRTHGSEICTWIGLIVILAVLFLPRYWVVIIGLVLMVVKDRIPQDFTINTIYPWLLKQTRKWFPEDTNAA